MQKKETKDKKSDLFVIYITSKCNFNCTYCYQRSSREIEEVFSLTEEQVKVRVDNIFKAVPHNLTAKILMFGGELFMNPKAVFATLEYLKQTYKGKRRFGVGITTNGSLLKPEYTKRLYKEYRDIIDYIDISIDGRRETFDKNRFFKTGVSAYDVVVRNAKFALRYFPHLNARPVVTDFNEMYDDVMHLRELGFRRFIIQAIKGGGIKYSIPDLDNFNYQVARIKTSLDKYVDSKIIEIQPPTPEEHVERKLALSKEKDEKYRYFLADGSIKVKDTFSGEKFSDF